MTDRITEIKEREAKAPDGPWRSIDGPLFDIHDSNGTQMFRSVRRDSSGIEYADQKAAADFIAHARADVPWLLEELRVAKVYAEDMRQHAAEWEKSEKRALANLSTSVERVEELEAELVGEKDSHGLDIRVRNKQIEELEAESLINWKAFKEHHSMGCKGRHLHHCHEWDGLLICSEWSEYSACICEKP